MQAIRQGWEDEGALPRDRLCCRARGGVEEIPLNEPACECTETQDDGAIEATRACSLVCLRPQLRGGAVISLSQEVAPSAPGMACARTPPHHKRNHDGREHNDDHDGERQWGKIGGAIAAEQRGDPVDDISRELVEPGRSGLLVRGLGQLFLCPLLRIIPVGDEHVRHHDSRHAGRGLTCCDPAAPTHPARVRAGPQVVVQGERLVSSRERREPAEDREARPWAER